MPARITTNANQPFDDLIDQLSQLSAYTIGRHADNAIIIPNNRISSHHALLIQCTSDSFVLEDVGSRNGSFVNGVRITRKVVDRNDTVQLADTDFTVETLLGLRKTEDAKNPVNKVAVPPPLPAEKSKPEANKDPLDFTESFAALQAVFEQYPKLRKDCRNREKMIRTGSIILSSIIGVSAAISTGGLAAIPFLHIMSGAGLSMLVPTLCSTLLSTEEKLEIIDKEYRERYRCPNLACRDPFGTREWELLAQQKNCRRCKAVWVA